MKFQIASLDGQLLYVSKKPHTGHGVCTVVEAENMGELIRKFDAMGIIVFDLDSGMVDSLITSPMTPSILGISLISTVTMNLDDGKYHFIGIAVDKSNQPMVYVGIEQSGNSYTCVLMDRGSKSLAMTIEKEN